MGHRQPWWTCRTIGCTLFKGQKRKSWLLLECWKLDHISQSLWACLWGCLHWAAPSWYLLTPVKINGAYYRDVLLSQHLLPQIREIPGEFFTFQQDSAPAHRARETVELLQRSTPDFISPLLWPPNSPDLNPVDYKIWSVLQEWVYRSRILDVSHLKERLVEEWSQFDQSIVERALKEWRVRLKACVHATGGHFEHKLQ